ncbi:MAG: phytoene/squalene synthase family protein [Methylococcaceae bacterium]|nr:phytoene/squalene synthase family protein [Methylococcaceae bacterium]
MSGLELSLKNLEAFNKLLDTEFQAILLEGVSRTFALTIPQLPDELHPAVANAYLLCRIVDTIEDEISLDAKQKDYFCSAFIQVVKTGKNAQSFSEELAPKLSKQTIPAEHCLIRLTPRVIEITHSFDPAQIDALLCCVETMGKGMPVFQAMNLKAGVKTMADMDNYCYYVAGCVGEMLAKLFCHYSADIDIHKDELLKLSVSFGQGLQMTNILKDIWDDAKREVCWLPQDIFTETGFDLKNLSPDTSDENFRLGLEHLISIANEHLQNALRYTQLIPRNETGIRNFCLWAIGMSVLTLKNIKKTLDCDDSSQVKITRRDVKKTILACKLSTRSNTLLSLLYNISSSSLKTPNWQYLPQTVKQ